MFNTNIAMLSINHDMGKMISGTFNSFIGCQQDCWFDGWNVLNQANACILSTIKDGLVVNVALPETAIDVQVLVNEVDFEAAMDVIRERSSQTLGE